jgi:AraC family transcriptional regulator, arabinose operon regulatory protein
MANYPRNIQAIEDRLRAAGLVFDRLEDVPPKAVREVNRRDFPDMRSIELPAKVILNALNQPLLRDLLVTRIGYHSRGAGHYIPRPEGSLDHILIHCVDGDGWLRVAEGEWTVHPGQMLCLPAGLPHWYGSESENPWSTYWIHFTGRQAEAYFQWLGIRKDNLIVHLSQREELLAAFEETWQCLRAVHTYDNLVQGSIGLTRFLGILQRTIHAAEGRQRAVDERVQKTIDFVSRNLAAELSLTELAQFAQLSVSRFTLAFRRVTGCSPMEYFNRLRVQRACELLQTTSKSVQEIGQKVGYNDPYYFSRAFKKIIGASPNEYRRK